MGRSDICPEPVHAAWNPWTAQGLASAPRLDVGTRPDSSPARVPGPRSWLSEDYGGPQGRAWMRAHSPAVHLLGSQGRVPGCQKVTGTRGRASLTPRGPAWSCPGTHVLPGGPQPSLPAAVSPVPREYRLRARPPPHSPILSAPIRQGLGVPDGAGGRVAQGGGSYCKEHPDLGERAGPGLCACGGGAPGPPQMWSVPAPLPERRPQLTLHPDEPPDTCCRSVIRPRPPAPG